MSDTTQTDAIVGLTEAVAKHTDETIKAVQQVYETRDELDQAKAEFLPREEQAADSRKLAGLTVNQLQAETVKQVRAEHGNVISPPTVSGNNSVIINQQATLTVTADSHLNQVAIADFTLTRPDGSTDTVMAVNGQSTFTTPVAGAVGSDQVFKVTSTDSLGNISNPAEYVVSIVDNQAPVMDGFSYSVPSVAIRGEAITARFLGATDPDGDNSQVTYSIVDTLGVTAGKTSGIGHNEAVTLTVDQISADMAGRITVKAVDQAGVQSGGVVIPLDLRAKAVVSAPSILSPANGTADLALQPVLTCSDYVVSPAGYDSHSRSQWQVLDTGGAVVWDSGETASLTSIAVGADLPGEAALDLRVRHKGGVAGWGDWSELVRVTTKAAGGPGHVYPDGGIGGPIVDGYQLIVAPASQRGQGIRHGLHHINTSLAYVGGSSSDPQSGWDNTNVLINGYGGIDDLRGSVGPVAAEYCRALGADWFLPNKEELKAVVDMAAQIDAADGSTGFSFSDMGSVYIWSSTASSDFDNWMVLATNGYIANSPRDSKWYVVPVRRVPV